MIESSDIVCERNGLACWILHEYWESHMDCICQEEYSESQDEKKDVGGIAGPGVYAGGGLAKC